MAESGKSKGSPVGVTHHRKKYFAKRLTPVEELEIFVKQMLCGRLFVGQYEERRYVEQLKAYRDVVVISNMETELKRDVEAVKSRLVTFCTNSWIGITGPDTIGAPAGHALWVKLREMPYGQYWFQIRKVKFSDDGEVIAILKRVREAKASSRDDSTTRDDASLNSEDLSADNDSILDHNKHGRKGFSIAAFNLGDFIDNVCSVVTLQNTKDALIFLSVLFVTCLTGLLHLIKELGNFTLKLMREFTYMLHVLVPVFLGVIDFFSKCVGGFYLLLTMMWKGNRNQIYMQQRRTPARALMYPK